MKKNMSKTILMIFGWLIIFTIGIAAQITAPKTTSEIEAEKSRQNREALEAAANLSPASRVLHGLLSSATTVKEEMRIVHDAVLNGDRSIIPYLKARKEAGLGPMQDIDLALVALGETQYVGKAIDELKSEDYNVQYYAIWKLARFKTIESYRKLYELLDDVTPRGPKNSGDAIYRTLSDITKDELFETVEDPPKDQHSTEAWKEWFRKHNLID